MRTTIVAAIISLLVGAGLYASVSNLATLYAVRTSGSFAGQYACTPDSPTHAVGQSIKFTASIPEGTAYYWSAPSASTSSFVVSGPLTAQYNRTGIKTVYLFFLVNNLWQRLSCSVQIK